MDKLELIKSILLRDDMDDVEVREKVTEVFETHNVIQLTKSTQQ